jgi:hypothetical protein
LGEKARSQQGRDDSGHLTKYFQVSNLDGLSQAIGHEEIPKH